MNKQLFCNECESLLTLFQSREGNVIGICSGCGKFHEMKIKLESTEKITHKELGKGIAKDDITIGFPHTCIKCGHNKCEVFDLGAPYSDESDIYLYKCKKCGFVERQADGTGNG